MYGKDTKMDELKQLLSEVSKEKMTDTIQWLIDNTPYRLAGSRDEEKASVYVCERMREYGLEVCNEEFYTYNSNPMYSRVEIISPVAEIIDSLPCAHIKSTEKNGEEFELVYVGDGSYESYKNIDIKDKIALIEVSYAPPVPEKARIAYELGAAGIMCMNWGNGEEVICNRALKAVWGNPTEKTISTIPDIIGVGITRNSGLRLKELCMKHEPVKVKITAIASREWSIVHQPKGILRGNGKSDDFLLVTSHLDAWQPGVTCNATGNATALEICRILSKCKEKLNRDVYFVFWNGHEIAEAAGSTWFVDNYWDIINKKCVGYFNIDSTGVSHTKIYEIKASDELLNFSVENFKDIMNTDEIRAMTLKKIGDQSFMGIGVPSVTQRMSFTNEDMKNANGATLGWWNHTKEDTFDKCDLDILVTDTEVTLSLIYRLSSIELLPYEFENKLKDISENINLSIENFSKYIDFADLKNNIDEAVEKISLIQKNKESYINEIAMQYNRYVMNVCRLLTNVFSTYCNKYQQDSYGYTKLSSKIPLFYDLEELSFLDNSSIEYGLLETQLIKNKNRINDCLKNVIDLSDLFILNFVK